MIFPVEFHFAHAELELDNLELQNQVMKSRSDSFKFYCFVYEGDRMGKSGGSKLHAIY